MSIEKIEGGGVCLIPAFVSVKSRSLIIKLNKTTKGILLE